MIGFAHRGGRADAPENTLEAFELALRRGARGLESDVWLTADGIAVLDHDGRVGGRWSTRRVGDLRRAELPAHIPALSELYRCCGSDFELSLDLKDRRALAAVVEAAGAAGPGAVDRLWLCDPDPAVLAAWRQALPRPRLVVSTTRQRLPGGIGAAAAVLAAAGISAVNLRADAWDAAAVAAVHRHGLLALAWDAQDGAVLTRLVRFGIDAVYSDHVPLLVEVLEEADGPERPDPYEGSADDEALGDEPAAPPVRTEEP